MARVAQVAPTDVPVLLLGETGSGKEVVAREIHRRSARAAGPVVRINCGAIPPGLIDSELFGHERGSFTGAVAARAGWFERADGGTLFLDEIGELAADAQVRLLRVVQDGTFERVGGARTYRADVRIVAATHRDLFSMVRAGTFREDLWYRIGVFPVPIPSLRERPQDIPALAAHFAWRAGQRLTGAPLAPTPADIDLLVSYSWPGNVRELAAVIERATILGGGHALAIAAALGGATQAATRVTSAPFHAASAQRSTGSEREFPTLDVAMSRHIEGALQVTRGKIEGPAGAAALLGINPHTLRARMRKLGIDWSRHRPLRTDLSTA
jgi:transcriptional regulator with GAF, ATPase, and Fis domain